MLLQELFNEENAQLKEVYGVTLDVDSTQTQYATPPENLEMIGFVFKVDDDLMIDEALLDVVISYKLTNLGVAIEVPSQLFLGDKRIEPKYLIQLASNVDFSISLLPPGHPLVGDSITMEQYSQVISSFTDELLNRQNFDKLIIPISNFFQYVMLEKLLGKDKVSDFRPEDEYIINNFSSILSVEHSDEFKSVIRNKLYDYYGSEAAFNEVAQLIFDSLYKKVKTTFTEHVRSSINPVNVQ